MRITHALTAVLLTAAVAASQSSDPNVLLIVADDLGVDYVGAYREGTSPPPTPNIDALAQRGVLFRNAWANPSCSPTRASILTGRYAFRTFVGRWIRHLSNSEPIGTLLPSEWTLPELLDRSARGYAHACVGKWHVHDVTHGLDAPRAIGGFSHYAGSLEGQIASYFRWTRVENGVAGISTQYCTTQTTDDALRWIGQQSQPWFLHLTYHAPHIPYHAPPANLHTQNLSGLTPVQTHTPQNRPFYRAMVESLDTEIGRLLRQLGPAVLAQTNIVFIGDNGSVQQQAVAPFNPSRAKGTPYEGGINVPLIVAGPAVASPGREVDALACSVDVFATVLELCGARSALPAYVVHDSVSLMPYLSDPAAVPQRQFTYCEEFTGAAWPLPLQNGHAVIRDVRYKLIHRVSGADELFDLRTDPWETTNVLSRTMTAAERQSHAALLNEIGRLRSPLASTVLYSPSTCQGSAGVPSITAQGVPRIGAAYAVQLASAAGSAAAALLLGGSMDRWNGLRLPLSLQTFGAGPGCWLASAPEMTLATSTDVAGAASVALQVPNRLALVGRALFGTWLVHDPVAPSNPLGVVSTGSIASIVGL